MMGDGATGRRAEDTRVLLVRVVKGGEAQVLNRNRGPAICTCG